MPGFYGDVFQNISVSPQSITMDVQVKPHHGPSPQSTRSCSCHGWGRTRLPPENAHAFPHSSRHARCGRLAAAPPSLVQLPDQRAAVPGKAQRIPRPRPRAGNAGTARQLLFRGQRLPKPFASQTRTRRGRRSEALRGPFPGEVEPTRWPDEEEEEPGGRARGTPQSAERRQGHAGMASRLPCPTKTWPRGVQGRARDGR